MPTCKIVNAREVFPEYIVRQLQQRLQGKRMLVYVPALPDQGEAPYNLRMVAYFTEQGWSAARIAARLKILKPHDHLVIGLLGRWSPWNLWRRLRGALGHPLWQRAHCFRVTEGLDL